MVRFACLYNALIYLGAGCFSVYYMVAIMMWASVLLISIVNVVFDVSESASELPTSVLFDRWSRERTLIIGVLCRVAGFILMLFWSANFAVLCLANVLAGHRGRGRKRRGVLAVHRIRPQARPSLVEDLGVKTVGDDRCVHDMRRCGRCRAVPA